MVKVFRVRQIAIDTFYVNGKVRFADRVDSSTWKADGYVIVERGGKFLAFHL